MPRCKPSVMEQLKTTVLAKWDYAARLKNIDCRKMATIMGIGKDTYYKRHKNVSKLTLEEIWAIERATGCELTVPFQQKN